MVAKHLSNLDTASPANKVRFASELERQNKELDEDQSFQQYNGDTGRMEIKINESLFDEMHKFCAHTGSSYTAMLLAATQSTMYHLGDKMNAAVGIVDIDHSEQPKFEPSRCFEAMKVIQNTYKSGQSYQEQVQQIQEALDNSLKAPVAPLEEVVRDLASSHGKRHGTIPQNVKMVVHRQCGMDGAELPFSSDVVRSDMEFHLFQDNTSIHGYVLYAEGLFHATTTIQNVVEVFLDLLNQGLKLPDTPISELPLVAHGYLPSRLERDILYQINRSGYPRDSSIIDLFRQQVQAAPGTVAVKDDSIQLTYGQLDQQSDLLAGWLIKQGQSAESPVGVFMSRSCQAILAFISILKAGLAYLPLDINAPAGRITAILNAVPSPSLLVLEYGASILGVGNIDYVRIVPITEALQKAAESRSEDVANTLPLPTLPLCSANSLAYIMFTSGSTGQPKGVMVEHRGVVRLVRQPMVTRFKPTMKVAHVTSLAFDVSTWEVFTALLNGGTLVCLHTITILDSSELCNRFIQEQINVAAFTPVLLQQCLDKVPSLFQSLGLLFSAGDRLTPSLVQKALLHTNAELFNAYGPTEDTGFSTCYRVERNKTLSTRTVPIGNPINGSGAIVADAKRRIVPWGIAGELIVFGDGLARGYLDPARNQGCFINLRLGNRTVRAYRTGDRVQRRLVDGALEFLGRIDHQVKIRGHRVELGEVEHTLLSNSSVESAVAILHEHEQDEPRLVAFVTMKPTVEIASVKHNVQLRKWVQMRLPEYMVPTMVRVLDQMPVNLNQKIDRPKLTKIATELRESRLLRDGIVLPRNNTERLICEQLAGILGVDVGITDNFFDLGGHSLLATRVVSRVNRTLNTSITIRDVFGHPLVSDLAQKVQSNMGQVPYTTIPHLAHNGPVQQSFAQSRLWFLDQLYPNSTRFVWQDVWQLSGPLDLEALRVALSALTRRHETLRTTFGRQNEIDVQIVQDLSFHGFAYLDIPQRDLQGMIDQLEVQQMRPFNLQIDSCWRVAVARIDQHHHLLSIAMHHIIQDGWSMDVLRKELGIFYSAALQGQDPLQQIAQLPIQYRDFSVWQRGKQETERHESQLKYWLQHLNNNSPAEFISDFPRPNMLSGLAGKVHMTLKGEIYTDLIQFCREERITVFSALFSAYRSAHFRLTGAEDATIGFPVANRNRQELEDLIGFFVNTRCIRSTVQANTSFKALVQQVQSTSVNAQENQDVPFERIVAELQLNRDMSRNPLVQLSFAVHAQEDFGELVLEGLDVREMHSAQRTRFDVEFHLFQDKSSIHGYVLYAEDLFHTSTIQNVVDIFIELLNQGLKLPNTPIMELPLAGCLSFERDIFHVDHFGYPQESSIVDLFRQRVQTAPDTVAVKDNLVQLTYAQLNQQSEHLAGWLIDIEQVRPAETLVGVFMPRSCRTIVAFMGILKAGLAYLPLDVSAPAGRTAAILATVSSLLVLEDGASISGVSNTEHVRAIPFTEALRQAVEGRRNSFVDTLPLLSATSLAYVMFTSGSTGQPKGVMAEHRGVVRLAREPTVTSYLKPPSAKVAHLATIAFDASTWEIYTALLNGGTLICLDLLTVLEPSKLLARFEQEHINAAKLTPVLLEQCFREVPEIFDSLDVLISSGDRLYSHLAQQVLEVFKGRMLNAYGPTESTGHSTCFELQQSNACASIIPIGQAINGSGAIVVDSKQQVVPRGVVGELLLTGDGLARGYLDPAQNQDRFINLEIGNDKTLRAYCTGDRARRRPVDGALEFLGRIDHQIKIRGYRVELGEIEHVLLSSSNGLIKSAVALLHEHKQNEPRLVAFVTLGNEINARDHSRKSNSVDESEEVQAWKEIRQSVVYANLQTIDSSSLGRDFVGWISMYDGLKIKKEEMEEWLQDTLKTIRSTCNISHILEIGTGTGMMLFNLIDGLESYLGLEPVQRAADFATERAMSIPQLAGKVEIKVAAADDVLSMSEFKSPTTVIINSVAQYFPSPEYLSEIISHLIQSGSVERIFFGDVRSFALYREFQVTMAQHHREAKRDKIQLRRYMAHFQDNEKELLVDPGFFTSFKDTHSHVVHHVEILPKRMEATNELSCYRYAAIIHVQRPQAPNHRVQHIGQDEWIDFVARDFDASALANHLTQSRMSSIVAVSNIPNRKIVPERVVLDDLDGETERNSEWISLLHSPKRDRCLSVTELFEIGKDCGFGVEVSCARHFSQRGAFDAVFYQERSHFDSVRTLFQFPTDHRGRPSSSFTNRPLQHRYKRRIEHLLRRELRTRLPSYMIPAVITAIEKMPINQNKKVDRRALSNMLQFSVPSSQVSEAVMPRNDIERAICDEYAEILGVEVGITSNFFDLGGHSLMATKVVSRINKRLNTGITIRDVFEYPMAGDLALRIQPEIGHVPYVPISRFTYAGPVPQSFAQSRLWFLDQLYSNSTQYLVPHRFRLRGPFSLAALHSAIRALEIRHETLRTIFAEKDGVNVQIVKDWAPKELKIVEVSPEELGHLDAILEKEQIRPFDLRNEASWRVAVFRINDYDHVLSIVLHHIVSDGWSMDVLRKELAIFYSAALHGNDPEAQLPGLAIQYRDFSAWQREGAQISQHKKQLDYWIPQLRGSRAAELICDKIRPPKLSGNAGYRDIALSPSLFNNLQEFAKMNQVTLFPILFSAFKATHFYVTGVEDANIGSLVANRHRQELEGLIGFFANLQCIRSTVNADTSFRTLVQQIRDAAAAAIENQDVPFEEIVANTKLTNRDPSRNPLVQITFAVHSDQGSSDLTLDGVDVELMVRSRRTRFDIEFHLFQDKSTIRGYVLYAEDLFYAATIQSVVNIFLEVLDQGIKSPETPISELSLMGCLQARPERDIFHINRSSYPRDSSIIDLFRQQVRIAPDAVAVKDDTKQQLTYAELDWQSDQLAGWLIEQDQPAETLVGIALPRSCGTVIAIIAILKASLAYLPLDVGAPAGRTSAILAAAAAASTRSSLLVLGDEASMSGISNIDHVRAVPITEALRQYEGRSDGFASAVPSPSPTNLAYVMFTSGSTGQPKGVMVEHRSVVRLVRQSSVTSRLKPNAKVAHLATIAFDASTWEIFTALLNGGTLVCLDIMVILDPLQLCARFEQEQIDVAKFTPVLLQQCLDRAPNIFRSLSLLFSAGDRLTPSLVHKAFSYAKNAELFNAYGPTENTGFSTCYHVDRNQSFTETVPIGDAIDGSGAIVINARQRAVPWGVVGELVVFGDGLARGYLDPTKNQGHFIDLQIGNENETIRAYCTGDHVWRRPIDGTLEFLGRIDHQVKVRGYRVELSEVEHALFSNSLVDNAVVLLQQEDDEPRLIAFVTIKRGQNTAETVEIEAVKHNVGTITSQLRNWVQARLPGYMVPAIIKVLDQMPVNLNRKVDRRMLMEMASEIGDSRSSRDIVPPRNDTERLICEELTSILGVGIGITDNFFDLGGHSLMATRAVSRIVRRLHCDLSVFQFYQCATPAALANAITLNSHFDPSAAERLPSYMLEFRRTGSKATLILVHGFWGQGHAFLSLVAILQHRFDIILIHDPFFGRPEVPSSLVEWANFYLNDLKTYIRQDLPVVLGGFSFGGLIAFQMASAWKSVIGTGLASILLLDAGSSPSLSQFFAHESLPQKSLDHALAIFGDEQKALVCQHFKKYHSLNLDEIDNFQYEGDGLYLVTAESSSAAWWGAHCPNFRTIQIDCAHYDVLDGSMAKTVAYLIDNHYRSLLD